MRIKFNDLRVFLIGLAGGFLSLSLLAAMETSPASSVSYKTGHSDPAGLYKIDPDHTSVVFTIGHAGVATVVGRFDTISGHYRLDPKKTDVRIDIATKSIDTNHPMRDKDLRGPDFLDSRTFPQIRFIASHFKKTGKRSGILTGKISLHGKTRTLALKVHEVGAANVSSLPKPWGGYLTGYDAEGSLRRSDFGITTYPSMIGDKMQIYISVEGIRVKK